MKQLREKIAALVEKKMQAAQTIDYEGEEYDRAVIYTKSAVFNEIADAVIPMVKEEINRKAKNPQ